MLAQSLARELNIGDDALVALIGAGGKTTTLLSLASSLAEGSVLLTTTTKIWPPDNLPIIFAETAAGATAQLDTSFSASRQVVLARTLGPDGKLHGIGPETLTALAGEIGRIIVCEADGAAGRPLKVHGAGEPLVPGGSTHVLAIAGLTAVGQTASMQTVHRVERYGEITGGTIGEPIAPVHVARALSAMVPYVPPGATLCFLLNQADSAAECAAAAAVASYLRPLHPGVRILATSRGTVVVDLS